MGGPESTLHLPSSIKCAHNVEKERELHRKLMHVLVSTATVFVGSETVGSSASREADTVKLAEEEETLFGAKPTGRDK